LSGAPLFTNVEPCWMCAYAIRQTRVSRIVFGSRNAQIGGGSSKFPVLRDENLKSPAPEILAEILTAKD
jgi:tRNA(adenine34) deaminase